MTFSIYPKMPIESTLTMINSEKHYKKDSYVMIEEHIKLYIHHTENQAARGVAIRPTETLTADYGLCLILHVRKSQ